MIPEQYWRIARRWFWLIGGTALVVAFLAAIAGPALLGGKSSGHSSAITLGVTRLVSFSGTVTLTDSGDPELLSSYTENIASRGNTPQFRKTLNDRLSAQGLVISDAALARKVDFKPVPGLFRIDITATGATAAEAEVIASTAAALLVEDVKAEEGRIKTLLDTTATDQQTQVLAQLSTVYQARIAKLAALGEPAIREALDNLVRSGVSQDLTANYTALVQDLARISADTELAALNSQAASLEAQLAQVQTSQRSFSDEILRGDAISTVSPVSTVQVPEETSLRTRDLLVMGLVAGLVLGWIAATLADGWAVSNRMERAKREEWDTTSTAEIGRFFSRD